MARKYNTKRRIVVFSFHFLFVLNNCLGGHEVESIKVIARKILFLISQGISLRTEIKEILNLSDREYEAALGFLFSMGYLDEVDNSFHQCSGCPLTKYCLVSSRNSGGVRTLTITKKGLIFLKRSQIDGDKK